LGFTRAFNSPEKLGGSSDRQTLANPREGDAREPLYLNGLRGPAREVIGYERLDACCLFSMPGEQARVIDVFQDHGWQRGLEQFSFSQ